MHFRLARVNLAFLKMPPVHLILYLSVSLIDFVSKILLTIIFSHDQDYVFTHSFNISEHIHCRTEESLTFAKQQNTEFKQINF